MASTSAYKCPDLQPQKWEEDDGLAASRSYENEHCTGSKKIPVEKFATAAFEAANPKEYG